MALTMTGRGADNHEQTFTGTRDVGRHLGSLAKDRGRSYCFPCPCPWASTLAGNREVDALAKRCAIATGLSTDTENWVH